MLYVFLNRCISIRDSLSMNLELVDLAQWQLARPRDSPAFISLPLAFSVGSGNMDPSLHAFASRLFTD